MPHADSSLISSSIQTKAEFWEHVCEQLAGLLGGQREWVSNLSNASSLVYNSLLSFPKFFGSSDSKAVNWCGFYIDHRFFPPPQLTTTNIADNSGRLLLGPFCGKPACQFIQTAPNPRGVCADAFNQRKTVIVPEVDLYPGHIACDGETKSEIVCPLLHEVKGETHALGVLDLDCLAVGGFDGEDKVGLERITQLIVGACDW